MSLEIIKYSKKEMRSALINAVLLVSASGDHYRPTYSIEDDILNLKSYNSGDSWSIGINKFIKEYSENKWLIYCYRSGKCVPWPHP